MFFQNKNKPCAILTKSKIMNMDITTSLLGDVSNLIDRAKNQGMFKKVCQTEKKVIN
ncbi:MAG: hypothetical protein ACEY3L_16390 [Wolbachia sp.]